MSADFWDGCPSVERGPDGRPLFEGTPIPVSVLFGVLANDMIAVDFPDAGPRHTSPASR